MKIIKNIICSIKFKYILLSVFVLICASSISFIDKNFWNTLLDSVKTTLESTKPTEELFDDTGRVKYISVLFDKNSCLVSAQPFDYELRFQNYDNFINNDGCITIVGASGILYAPSSGKVHINALTDGVTEIKIEHNSQFMSVFAGQIGLGVNNDVFVQKGQPLAILLGDLQFFVLQNGEILDSIDFSNGEMLWKE